MTVGSWIRRTLVVVAAVVLIIVMFQNGGQEVKFLFWSHTPAWMGLLVITLIGFVAGLATPKSLGKRKQG